MAEKKLIKWNTSILDFKDYMFATFLKVLSDKSR